MNLLFSSHKRLIATTVLSTAALLSACSTEDGVDSDSPNDAGTGSTPGVGGATTGGSGSGDGGVGPGSGGVDNSGGGPGSGGAIDGGGGVPGGGGAGAGGSDGSSGGDGSGGSDGGGGDSNSGGADGSGGQGTGGGEGILMDHRTCDGSNAPALKVTEVATGFSAPVFVTSDPTDATRLFVVDLTGKVFIVSGGNKVQAASIAVDNSFGEKGMHSMAFHPNFGSGGENRVYLAYNQPNGDTRVIQSTLIGDTIDTTDLEGKTILFQAQPDVNHNGGQLQFGPDGYLYFGLGDGGGSCNQYKSANDLTTPLATIVRLNVEDLDSFPEGNIGTAGGNDGRIFHHGLRNPWRFSFDRGTDDLYIGDVGQNKFEEIDILPAGSPSTDFGWPSREGTHSSSESNCSDGADATPDLWEPVFDYPRSQGQSVTGGYVYRGPAIPGLQGRYLFADYQSKRIWNLTWDGSQMCDFAEITEEIDPDGDLGGITSFGEDANGEIYIASVGTGGGKIFRIDPE